MFDMLEELAAIHRNVVRNDAGEKVAVTLSRAYDAKAEDVWDALTNPERLPRWFYPISGDLRVGGSFQLEGNAGGKIRRCDRQTWLRVTFGGPDSVLDVHLAATGDKTTVELTHTVPLAMAGSGAGALFVGPGWGRRTARARDQPARTIRPRPPRGGELAGGHRVQPGFDRPMDRSGRVLRHRHEGGDRGRP